MEVMIKIALIGVVVALIILLMKGFQSRLTPMITISASVLLSGMVLKMADSAIDSISEIFKASKMENESIKNVIKIVGVAYVADFSSSICRDLGENSIASKIEIAGRVYIVLLAVPWASMLIEAINALGG